ncbi:hypothetical protein BC939DRAFT_441212 [Gamsiella multidivaricata]|uniref:uncharacterized protein n=1 Tax=Gamsiella multidivaricata TaxID=101098 RepID=UPI002220E9DB|nr:uncharacterized protein BC939DRAFT_441212 [Gamsiella multidivaricata]KAI7829604.1 hypothetical protein BC939DRAFT_441212 [Gamsiella multidivaricata]
MTATTANSTAPANGEPAANSHEVGMMFVHEYYTFLNKEPSRLHCFYNKQSTMSHGIQGEEPHICHGQQSIHAKILELDFEDCKVLVSNVDSQSSLNGGIMVQVLGEMSNKGGPSQKFVQTFFLAEQPKGYYVLNDIFRYLKDDNEIEVEVAAEEAIIIESDEANLIEVALAPVPIEEAAVCEVEVLTIAVPVEATEPIETAEPTETVEPTETAIPIEIPAAEPVEEKKPVIEEKKHVEKKAEHKRHDKKTEKKDARKEDSKDAKKDAKKDIKKEAEPAEKPKTPEPSKKQNGAATTTAAASEIEAAPAPTAAAPVETPAPTPAPAPVEPSKPKTWANLAAINSNQWGAHVAPAKGSSINVSQPTPKPQAAQPTQNRPQGQRHSGREEVHGIYVKNITDKMSLDQLREAFNQFGPVKNVERTSKRNCAYVDFESVEAVQAALKQNKVNVGSEIVLAEERRPSRNVFQNSGRPFHYQNGSNGHQGPQGGNRGRPSRGGFQDRKPIQRPEKVPPTVAVN